MNARLIIISMFWCVLLIPSLSDGSVINLFIEAQKQVIAREEALLKQAQDAVKERIDQAFEAAHEALLNVVQQVHYYATYPFRAGNEMVEQSMNMLSNATSSLAGYLPSFGSQTNETAQNSYGIPGTAGEPSFINRVQQMGEQLSRLSGVRVVMHTASEGPSSGPMLEIGFGGNERNESESGNGGQ
ncbi:uncharacterized protein LOC134215795 [Armigeres subalbatus]|uniref:uncharacterized protein LOC134215795 n=1 Tax=Armigeres subalbatus TaxID=124917 RepID=UPI002ED010E6